MSPVATWSSEWHIPEAASLTWISPGRGSSETRSTTSYLPGASRMIAPRVSTGTGNLLVALVEGRDLGMRERAWLPRTLWPPSHRRKTGATFGATSRSNWADAAGGRRRRGTGRADGGAAARPPGRRGALPRTAPRAPPPAARRPPWGRGVPRPAGGRRGRRGGRGQPPHGGDAAGRRAAAHAGGVPAPGRGRGARLAARCAVPPAGRGGRAAGRRRRHARHRAAHRVPGHRSGAGRRAGAARRGRRVRRRGVRAGLRRCREHGARAGRCSVARPRPPGPVAGRRRPLARGAARVARRAPGQRPAPGGDVHADRRRPVPLGVPAAAGGDGGVGGPGRAAHTLGGDRRRGGAGGRVGGPGPRRRTPG